MGDYFFGHNALSESCIADIYSYMARAKKRPGLTGNRVNLKHKNRYDIYVSSEYVLSCIDKEIFKNYGDPVLRNLNKKIMYREPYKVGVYEGEDNSFYNIHTDDARETRYRCVSMVLALTPPDQYEGGFLEFPDLNLSLKLEYNTAIFFKSSLRHRVTNVESGNRNVLISFFFDEDGGKLKTELKSDTDRRTLEYYKPVLQRAAPKSKVDVDYNDNSPHEWTNKDSSWFVDNGSDILLVSFSGFGSAGSIPTFIFHNFLKNFGYVDQLFIRDLSCRWYLDKIKSYNENDQRSDVIGIQNIQKWIHKLTNVKNYKRIISIGCSSGGFAAILYSSLLNFDKCIAFSPQSVISKDGRAEVGDERYPKTSNYIQGLLRNTENSKYMDLQNLELISTDIHYGARSDGGIDARHSERLECNLFPHNSNQHMIALELRNSGILKIILANAIMELKESIKIEDEKTAKMFSEMATAPKPISKFEDSTEPDYDEFDGRIDNDIDVIHESNEGVDTMLSNKHKVRLHPNALGGASTVNYQKYQQVETRAPTNALGLSINKKKPSKPSIPVNALNPKPKPNQFQNQSLNQWLNSSINLPHNPKLCQHPL